MDSFAIVYHPDPEINESVRAAAVEAEIEDMANGWPPRRWTCPRCRRSHSRGHFLSIGQHRCLACGYVGVEGVMWDPQTETDPATGEPNCTPAAAI